MAKYMAVFVILETLDIDGAYKAEINAPLADEYKSVTLQSSDGTYDLSDEEDKENMAMNIERLPSFAHIKKVKAFPVMYTEYSPGSLWLPFGGGLYNFKL